MDYFAFGDAMFDEQKFARRNFREEPEESVFIMHFKRPQLHLGIAVEPGRFWKFVEDKLKLHNGFRG